jgi:hypothetical protein
MTKMNGDFTPMRAVEKLGGLPMVSPAERRPSAQAVQRVNAVASALVQIR